MPKYYAVRDGRNPGVYDSWDDCKAQTNGYSNAKFKSFNSAEEANNYVSGSSSHSSSYSNERSYDSYPNYGSYSGYSSGNHSGGSSSSGRRLDIYTDGACPNNGYDGAQAGIGVHFPDYPQYDISEPLSGRQTNNRAEIQAAVRGIEMAKQMKHNSVTIHTDSDFLHKSVTQWKDNWKSNGWNKSDGKPVINRDDFLDLEAVSQGMDIKWNKVPAHKGVPGNEEADRLANKAINKANKR